MESNRPTVSRKVFVKTRVVRALCWLIPAAMAWSPEAPAQEKELKRERRFLAPGATCFGFSNSLCLFTAKIRAKSGHFCHRPKTARLSRRSPNEITERANIGYILLVIGKFFFTDL